jgi:phage-related tail fiber protein
MWDITMRHTVSTAVLHLFDSSYGTTDYVKQRIQEQKKKRQKLHTNFTWMI